ncbi:hypothetical protein GALMADRAFT_155696 [Galerina marginata CBS 339.88]|uniref:Uncharacterized protein n=1 Tax=Galerina marginata (strain CBS 339.88) TaxID=685588 RepID=A0A067T3X3_GALM3|nr:hypothetical protein GALMADRAFT_155696 [Galerina marginata CBS 339.88]
MSMSPQIEQPEILLLQTNYLDSGTRSVQPPDSAVDLGSHDNIGGNDLYPTQLPVSQGDANSTSSTTRARSVMSAGSSLSSGQRDVERQGHNIIQSGLLAAVAAQLLVFFKTDSSYADDIPKHGGAKGFLLASCYVALFLNISATISSFILIDNLGEIGYRASCNEEALKQKFGTTNTYTAGQEKLLAEFGASEEWEWMLFHWLATFYSGILALIISVLTYVSMQEALATKIVMGVTVFLTLGPVSYFIFRPLFKH